MTIYRLEAFIILGQHPLDGIYFLQRKADCHFARE